MPNYIVDGRDTNTANTSILGVTRGSGRLLIYEVMVGPTGAAGVNVYFVSWQQPMKLGFHIRQSRLHF